MAHTTAGDLWLRFGLPVEVRTAGPGAAVRLRLGALATTRHPRHRPDSRPGHQIIGLAGCYVPRFIESNPEHAISLHTWGIAVALDAATNRRGISGVMNPGVVATCRRWGFRWGGDFRYSDLMHVEIGALLSRPR